MVVIDDCGPMCACHGRAGPLAGDTVSRRRYFSLPIPVYWEVTCPVRTGRSLMGSYLATCLVVFFAGFTQGVSGFGSAMVALPLLALFMDVKTVVPVVGLVGLAVAILVLLHVVRHVERKTIVPLLVSAAAGVPVGVLFLKEVDKDTIRLIMGILLVGYAVYGLCLGSVRKNLKGGWAYAFGFLAGCLGGSLSVPGPPVIVYTSLQRWNKDTIKATLQAFLFVTHVAIVAAHALTSVTTATVITLFLASSPALIVGTLAGFWCYGRLAEESYRRTMFLLMGCPGAFMIYQHI